MSSALALPRCYACDATATGTADRRHEAQAAMVPACDRHAWAPEALDRDEVDARIDADRDSVVEQIDREVAEPADLLPTLCLALRFVPLHVEAQDHRKACRCVACQHRAAVVGGL